MKEMEDKLESFIRENRRSFDMEEPPAAMWGRIEGQLGVNKRVQLGPEKKMRVVPLQYVLKGAASIALLICSVLWLYTYTQTQSAELTAIDPQLTKQQVHYANLIESKRDELKRIEQDEPRLYQEFSAEIRKMDENYRKLQSDLVVSPNQEEIFKAMIRNLKIQTELLNQQLRVIEQINKVKRDISHENQNI